MSKLSDILLDFAQLHTGPVLQAKAIKNKHGNTTQVFCLTTYDHKIFYLKSLHKVRQYRQELQAYLNWQPQLSDIVPELKGSQNDLCALLIRGIQGIPADKAHLNKDQNIALFKAAGIFKRRLMAIDFDDVDSLCLNDALWMRFDQTLKDAKIFLDENLYGWALKAFEIYRQKDIFSHVKRTPCHRDFSPYNWIVNTHPDLPQVTLNVIDFEHALNDFWLVDFLKVWAYAKAHDHDYFKAFLEGVQMPLNSKHDAQLYILLIWHGINTALWGIKHNNLHFKKEGFFILKILQNIKYPSEIRNF